MTRKIPSIPRPRRPLNLSIALNHKHRNSPADWNKSANQVPTYLIDRQTTIRSTAAMKFFAFLVPALTVLASAAPIEKQKQVIISYPNETPSWVLDQAKQAIRDGGGVITHEFELIMGFAATVAESVLNSVQAMNNDYHAVIEEDQVVTIS
ncbi:hypothetical protein MAPG_10920 [Magnaporthiopsis poae ATCC 64411]|uniref:Inhibitor I9 domain-containing protein n=1 Tax=Magnaporthiopsis poae (strain ATCC 64411 / 73-15) TaxID=644358 RepID=A0A0C4EDV9_MAGP6|nr:hypothetical protein MAPG_10920 [Magnaporthiopsis poae ATCC 64411]